MVLLPTSLLLVLARWLLLLLLPPAGPRHERAPRLHPDPAHSPRRRWPMLRWLGRSLPLQNILTAELHWVSLPQPLPRPPPRLFRRLQELPRRPMLPGWRSNYSLQC